MERTIENSARVKRGVVSTRKKRLLTIQARHSLAFKEKCFPSFPENNSNEAFSETSSKPQNIEKFQQFLHQVPESFCNRSHTKFSSNDIKSHQLEHSASFPDVSVNTYNFPLSKSISLPSQNFNVCSHNTVSLNRHFEETSNLQPEKVALNCLSTNCKTSVEDSKSIHTLPGTSNTSAIRDRTESVDSNFSQISISEIKEIEEGTNLRTSNLDSKSCWKPQHSRSRSDASCGYGQFEVIDENETASLPNSFSEKLRPQRKSIFEGKPMPVQTECFFPQPQQGQSITSFLTSTDFNISAELDRENAHFCISEALISAIEHMKCSRTMKIIEEEEESDEEIRKLTQRIRIRRKERNFEKTMKSIVLLSDGKTDTTTSQSASPPVSSQSSDFEVDSIGSEDEVEDLELSAHTDSNLSSIKESGLSLSMASLYSEADIKKALLQRETKEKKYQDSDCKNLSAESVALSLIKRFSDKHLPKASELQWIVSEQEVPQRLLPLPNSWPVSPDIIEEEYSSEKTRLRGTLDWAPPRPQIISCLLPNLKRKDIIEKQKYKCAGCGMKIEKNYISRFRYCNYFGKYFCQCCHSNDIAYIPGRILWKCDFTKYYVSRQAHDLIDNMFSDPLFNIDYINNSLYKKFRQLELSRICRMQLFYLKDFMRTCRKAEGIKGFLEKQNQYILCDPHTYSLSDLVQVKSGVFLKQLRLILNPCLEHLSHCVLCQAKGFVCEICQKDKDIIFPFQLQRVVLCQVCGSCFHKSCFKNGKCPRCVRIAERKKRQNENNPKEIFV